MPSFPFTKMLSYSPRQSVYTFVINWPITSSDLSDHLTEFQMLQLAAGTPLIPYSSLGSWLAFCFCLYVCVSVLCTFRDMGSLCSPGWQGTGLKRAGIKCLLFTNLLICPLPKYILWGQVVLLVVALCLSKSFVLTAHKFSSPFKISLKKTDKWSSYT